MLVRRLACSSLWLSLVAVAFGCGASVEPAAAPTPSSAEAARAAPATSATVEAPAAPTRVVEVSEAEVALLHRARTAVRLGDGRIFAAGSDGDIGSDVAEIFDPKIGKWTRALPMKAARANHAIVALADGKALVCGGEDATKAVTPIHAGGPATAECELFDPVTAKWSPAAPMSSARRRFTMTRLADGRVLAVGNPGSEIFDPKAGKWGVVLATAVPYFGHTATLLQDGRVLVVGVGNAPPRASAELFDPKTEKWSPTLAGMPALIDHTATLMPDGSVLIAGGQTMLGLIPQPVPFASVFEPKRERWNVTGQPHANHWRHGALLLPNGDVVVAGGPKKEGELYSHEVWRDVPPELAAKLKLELTPPPDDKKK
jgi:hypothetical protein